MTTADQWRAAAAALREHAAKFEKLAGGVLCGVVLPNAGPAGEAVACASVAGHDGPHSWAFLPTVAVLSGRAEGETGDV